MESSFDHPVDEPDDRIAKFVVGLHLGTRYVIHFTLAHTLTIPTSRYTSVAFTHSENPSEMKIVQIWPGASLGGCADRVPTKLDYTKPEMKWGYEVTATDPGSRPLMWFNLLLQGQDESGWEKRGASQRMRSQWGCSMLDTSALGARFGVLEISPLTTPAQETSEILRELNITPVKAVADFLMKIRETTLEDIKRTYGVDDWVGVKVEWILTVPAIWTDSAKNQMIQAARQAGFGERMVDFELISETECRATYSLKVIQPNDLMVSFPYSFFGTNLHQLMG
jgi:hypothetical protein